MVYFYDVHERIRDLVLSIPPTVSHQRMEAGNVLCLLLLKNIIAHKEMKSLVR